MKPRLLLDEDTHIALAEALRQRGFDVLHIQEAGRKGFSDAEQLEFALKEQRCIFSLNRKDFAALHTECVLTNRNHYGIIVGSHLPISPTLHRLSELLRQTTAEELCNELRHI